jgi:ABC-type dipeptide/oligopeptide/nickel transport system permease subunit
VWHLIICAGCGVLGLIVGWSRGLCVGYQEGRVDSVMEQEELREIDRELRKISRG